MPHTELKLGGLYLVFRSSMAAKLDQPISIENEDYYETSGECQWAFYLHYGTSEGGILYQVKKVGAKLVADHGNTKDIYSIPGHLNELKYVAEWPTYSLVKIDCNLRGLDRSLEHLKEKTSLKWAVMVCSYVAALGSC